MTRRVTVDAAMLERIGDLIAGRVYYGLDLGLPLDNLDGQRIREAHTLLTTLRRTARWAGDDDDTARLRALLEGAE